MADHLVEPRQQEMRLTVGASRNRPAFPLLQFGELGKEVGDFILKEYWERKEVAVAVILRDLAIGQCSSHGSYSAGGQYEYWVVIAAAAVDVTHLSPRAAAACVLPDNRQPFQPQQNGRQNMAGTKMGVVGCGGRMGRMLVAEIAATEGCSVAGGSEAPGSGYVNQDIGELAGIGRIGIPIGETVEKLMRDSDVVLEFTSPAATAEHAELAADLGTAMVIGTTGLSPEQGERVREAARNIPIVWAPNMSLGVNVLLSIVEEVAKRLGPDWDIEIMEMHHRGKVDAPSGTALALGHAAAAGRGVRLEDVEQRARDGITGPRHTGNIGFAALRGGDTTGDHHVIFAAAGERLELTHRATTRAIYAKGAVRAARWVVGRPPGVYGLKEVLGL
jgi:4-hydroxy-tetrahydrodipicolinate reductase